jgi:hypothetical protein
MGVFMTDINDTGFRIKNIAFNSQPSIFRICPNIRETETSEPFCPIVDIYWNQETKELDVKYDGPISGAVKTLMNQFAETFTSFIRGGL